MEGKKYQDFWDTNLWKKAFACQKEVFCLLQYFPPEEKYGLGKQLLNASNSVVANIAEMHGRYYFKDKIRVLYIVRGELQETQSHLIVAVSRGYLSQSICKKMVQTYQSLSKDINKTILHFSKKSK